MNRNLTALFLTLFFVPFGLSAEGVVDVRPKGGKPGPTTEPNISVLIADAKAADGELACSITVKPDLGTIETAALVLKSNGKQHGRALLGIQKLEGQEPWYEVYLTAEMLKESELLLRVEKDKKITNYKMVLGTFPVHKPK